MVESITALYRSLLSLSVYRGVLEQPVASRLLALLRAASAGDDDGVYAAWGALAGRLAGDSLPRLLLREAQADENAFTLAGGAPAAGLAALAARDLDILWRAAARAVEAPMAQGLPPLAAELPPAPFDRPWGGLPEEFTAFHRRHGVGRFIHHTAFIWSDGALRPVAYPDPIRLSGLKEYACQRDIAVGNTRAFLDGLAANNMLLYGDRGTGKSSTVKALLNEYAAEGLRMIEMPKAALLELPELTDCLAAIPMKFIIFIDDLSFAGGDSASWDHFAALKAALEGGLASRPPNVLIYATSNRRHLLRETFSDRSGDEVHHADTVQESVSLSDRFGLVLTYLMPDKRRFLSIVEQLADDEGLTAPRGELLAAAERWALERGARSPRFARQFIQDAQTRLHRGEPL